MGIVKVHRYGVRADREGSQTLSLQAPGKPLLHVATPPDFKNGVPGVWSPEELLIGSLAACFELTAVAIADYKGVPLHTIRVDATGHVERRDNQYRFVLLELDVDLETDAGREHDAEWVAEVAKERCIVGSALGVPVRLEVETHAVRVTGTAPA